MRIYDVGPATLTEDAGLIRTQFKVDSTQCVFGPPRDEQGAILPSFVAAAHEMGYSDPMRYAVEHEIAHHIVAKGRGQAHSSIVWDSAHNVAMSLDEPERAAEEHLVNRLQRYMNLGEVDPYGCLQDAFGDQLNACAQMLFVVSRPWLRAANVSASLSNGSGVILGTVE